MKTYTLEELAIEFGLPVSKRRKPTIVQKKHIEGPWWGIRVIRLERTSKGIRRTFSNWLEIRSHRWWKS